MNSKANNLGQSLPYSLWRAQQVRDNEQKAAASLAIDMYSLMDKAGHLAFDTLREKWPEAKRILVLCGKGNNGGDGYVLAALAKDAGLDVQLCQLTDESELTGDAAVARNAWLVEQGVSQHVAAANFNADVIVDAILGTGLSGDIRSDYLDVINKINQSNSAVLSIDIPSGLNADTGAIMGEAVKADVTVTFVALKQGMFTGLAAQCCGEIIFDDLGIGEAFEEQGSANIRRTCYGLRKSLLSTRCRVSHKGHYGKIIVAGGNKGMPGSIRLAGEACLRTGAALVKVVSRPENTLAIMSGRPELMLCGFEGEDWQLNETMDWASTVIVGPGLGQDEWAKTLLTRCLDNELPKVVDADGLNLLVEMPTWKDNWILTPHPGEAAHLLGCSITEVVNDRYTAVRNLQQRFGGVVVLKGAGTLICDGEQTLVANVGNPGMASGGMGDVLSGIIAGLLAQGLSLLDAAALGVCIHGDAADMAVSEGERGLLASDLFPYVRRLVNPDES